MSFKKLMVLPLLIATLGIITPAKKANAGVLLVYGTASLFSKEHKNIGYAIGGTLGTVSVIGGIYYGAQIYSILPPFSLIIMGGSVVLDAQGNLSKSELANLFTEKYNFIDNQTVINNLVQNIKSKYDLIQGEGYIALTESETRSILAPADLAESEIEQVVADLK